MTIEAMIKILERGQRVPGTIIQKVILEEGGLVWSVGVGEMDQVKEFRCGPTIRAALMQFPRVRRALTRRKKVCPVCRQAALTVDGRVAWHLSGLNACVGSGSRI